jgi:hypothetical protein
MTAWLDQIAISEFSELIARPRSASAGPGICGALPARAFRHRYPAGCLREADHCGSHSPEASNAARLDTAAARRRDIGAA